jgi:hypothetical protein
MANPRYNTQTTNRRGAMKGGRMKKMGGGMMMKKRDMLKNGSKPVSKSKNPGLAKMAKTAKGKMAVKKMGFNPDRMVAKKGGKA